MCSVVPSLCIGWRRSSVWFTVLMLSCTATTFYLYDAQQWMVGVGTFTDIQQRLQRFWSSHAGEFTSSSTSSLNLTETTRSSNIQMQRRQVPHAGRQNSSARLQTSTAYPTVTTGSDPRWLPIDKSHPDIYVYAAYFDDIDSISYVRVLAVSRGRRLDDNIQCLYFTSDRYDKPMGMTRGKLRHYMGSSRSQYRGAFAKCPLLKSDPRPHAISLVMSTDDDAFTNVTTVLHVNYSDRQGKGATQWNVTKCFPALYRYSNVMQLIQQVEISSSVGVEHFLFYNLSVSPQVSAILQYYIDKGIADIVDWHYPDPMKQAKYFNQMEAIQDCIYRNLHSTRFLLLGDIDEITVPRSSKSVLHLLEHLYSQQPDCGTFVFLNTFFPVRDAASKPRLESAKKTLSSSNFKFALENNLNMLLVQDRITEIWTSGRRAKPAVVPADIEAGSIHNTLQHRPWRNLHLCKIPPELGLLHHYRNIVPPQLSASHQAKGAGTVQDTDLLRFVPNIVERIKRVLRDLKNVAKLS